MKMLKDPLWSDSSAYWSLSDKFCYLIRETHAIQRGLPIPLIRSFIVAYLLDNSL